MPRGVDGLVGVVLDLGGDVLAVASTASRKVRISENVASFSMIMCLASVSVARHLRVVSSSRKLCAQLPLHSSLQRWHSTD